MWVLFTRPLKNHGSRRFYRNIFTTCRLYWIWIIAVEPKSGVGDNYYMSYYYACRRNSCQCRRFSTSDFGISSQRVIWNLIETINRYGTETTINVFILFLFLSDRYVLFWKKPKTVKLFVGCHKSETFSIFYFFFFF